MSAFDIPSYQQGQAPIDNLGWLAPGLTGLFGFLTGDLTRAFQGLGGLGDAAQVAGQNQYNAERMGAYGQHFEQSAQNMQDILTQMSFNIQGPGDMFLPGTASLGNRIYTKLPEDAVIQRHPGESDFDYENRVYELRNQWNVTGHAALPTINLGINPAQAGADTWNAYSQAQNLTDRAQGIADYSGEEALNRILGGQFGTEGIMTQVQDLLGGLPGRIKEGLGGIRADVGEIIKGGKIDPDALAARIMALYPTDGIDASADIAQLGILASKMDEQSRQAGAASGGRGPLNAAELEAARMGYAPQLAAQGLAAERAADQFNIGLQQTAAQAGTGGMTLGEQINAQLTGQEANLATQLGLGGLGFESTAAQALASTLANLSGQRGQSIMGMEAFQQGQRQLGLEDLIRLGAIDAQTAERASQGDLDAQERIMNELLRQQGGAAAGQQYSDALVQALMNAEMNPGALGSQSLLASDFLKATFPGAYGLKPEEPEQPSPWESLIGPAAGGVGQAGTMMLMKSFTGMCISATTELLTPTGWKRLADIKVGDQVINPEGIITEVIDKDYGLPHHTNFRTIDCGNWSITLSDDHIVEGKAADRWSVGDLMDNGQLITDITPVKIHVPCGDIKLKVGKEYLARGFVVTSMFGKDD